MRQIQPPDAEVGSELFAGPDEFAEAVWDARGDSDEGDSLFGNITEYGFRRLIRIAYFASQAPNEGRFPRMTLRVPAKGIEAAIVVPVSGELTVEALRRLGPTLNSRHHSLVVREQNGVLLMTGIAATGGALTEMSLGDQLFFPISKYQGLTVEVDGPGELFASEHRAHRLQAGSIRQEISFLCADWFREWYEEAARAILGDEIRSTSPAWPVKPGIAIANVWQWMLLKAAYLRHGASFVILPNPAQAPLRHTFRTPGCDLGAELAALLRSTRQDRHLTEDARVADEDRFRLVTRQRSFSSIEAVVNLSATDGCIIFNRRLELYSFGSMIEVGETEDRSLPCYRGESNIQLDDTMLRSFGARRRSAVRLCLACPGAIVFVISQDRDLRIVVRRNGAVHFYDNAAYR